jgi:hypothetical protein
MRVHDVAWTFAAEHAEVETVAVQVLMGRGLGVVASMAVHGFETDELVRIPIRGGPVVQRQLVWRRGALNRTAASLVGLLREFSEDATVLVR